MTPAETAETHRGAAPRRWLWNFIVFGVVGCLLGVGNLYYVEHEHQSCLDKYMVYDSEAKKARAKSSKVLTNALVAQSDSFVDITTPVGSKPTKKEIADFFVAIAAVKPAAHANDEEVKAHPYYKFKDVCR